MYHVDASELRCSAVLSVDIMDISGESQFNIMHEIERTRLHANGQPVFLGTVQGELRMLLFEDLSRLTVHMCCAINQG